MNPDRQQQPGARPGRGSRLVWWSAAGLVAVAAILVVWGARRGARRDARPDTPPERVTAEFQRPDVNVSTPPWNRADLAERGVSREGALPSQLPAFRVGQRQIDDPSRDGWASEAWSRRTDKQLSELGAWLRDPDKASTPLVAIAAADFVSTALFATVRDTVYAHAGLRVFRARAAMLEAAAAPHRGAEGLRAALATLRQYMRAGDAPLRLKLKTVGIEPAPSGARTRVLFSANRGAAHEVHATWECTWVASQDTEAPRLVELRLLRFQDIHSEQQRPLLADCTASLFGDDAVFRDQLRPGIHRWLKSIDVSVDPDFEGMQGLALGDVNGDELEDVYICQGGGLPNRLFVQRYDGTLEDVSHDAGVDWLDTTRSALLVDLDNDSDADLALAMDDVLILMENDASGRFTERARFPSVKLAFSLAAADYDRDGDLDLYACRYFAESEKSVGQLPNPVPYHDANNGGRNVLLRNTGGFVFDDATEASGLETNNRRWSYAAAWDDYDNDGDVDLYVANDFGRNNLYRNDEGRFTDVSAAAGVEDIASGMSVTWGDFNNDGWMDLYVSNMFSSAGNRITFRRSFQPNASETTRAWYQRLARGNTLFQNNGDGTFRDVSEDASVTMGRWSWGSRFADLNNDGFEDIVVANGYVTGDDTGDL